MKLNKLIKKIAGFTRIDILNVYSGRLFPIATANELKTENNIKDLKKYKVKQIIAFTQEPGIITIYVEKVKKIV